MEKFLVDSSVFLDVLFNTPRKEKAKSYLEEIEKGKSSGVASALCILEVKYHAMKKLGHERGADAAYLIETFRNLEVMPASAEICALAADLRYKYYDKADRPMSFADAVHIATGLACRCTKLLSSDGDFRHIDEIPSDVY